MKTKKTVTVAGFDPTAGAGVLADLRTFTNIATYGVAVTTAIAVQDTTGVKEIFPLPAGSVKQQLSTLFEDVKIDALKTGMLLTRENILSIEEAVKKYKVQKFVLDPIIKSGTGVRLLKKNVLPLLKERLFPLAMIITPNINEAEMLTGIKIKNEKDVSLAAKVLYEMGPKYVLIKGGHLKGEPNDFLYNGKDFKIFKGKRISRIKLHGAGCVFSAAITAYLAKGLTVEKAVRKAKRFINKRIRIAIGIGSGKKILL